jgi:dTDP-4-dehydrorhamnose 3,5-epimerase
MEFKETEISGVWVIEPKVFNDARGYFFEAWKKEEFEAHIGQVDFLQDNESKSSYGVLRGLHYQKGEFSQAKSCGSSWERCSSGGRHPQVVTTFGSMSWLAV